MSRKRRDRQRAARDQPPSEPAPPSSPTPSPTDEWTWGGGYDRCEAALGEHAIIWSWFGPKDLGGSTDQTITEFLAFGPHDKDAPEHVVVALREAIRARDPVHWPQLLADAEDLREGRERGIAEKQRQRAEAECAAEERFKETQAWPDPWRRYAPHTEHPKTRTENPEEPSNASQSQYTRRSRYVWEWGEAADGYTAILSNNSISWNWHGPKDLGNTIEQSVVDFIAYGSAEKNAPDGIGRDLRRNSQARPQKVAGLLVHARALHEDEATPASSSRQGEQSENYHTSHDGLSWEWGTKYNRYSAWFTDNGIYWSWEGEKDLGGSSEQSFAEFLSDGPLDTDAPAGVVREIREAMVRSGGAGPSPPPGGQRTRSELPARATRQASKPAMKHGSRSGRCSRAASWCSAQASSSAC